MTKYPYTALLSSILCFFRCDIVESNLLLSQPSTSNQEPEIIQSFSSISDTHTPFTSVQETSSSLTK